MRRASFLLALLLTLSQAGVNAASGTLPFEPSPAGFASALNAREFAFPRDHGPHPDFAHEWWYVTGHLATPDGRKFGFELTFFRVALAPPHAADRAPGGSRWRTRQIYVAHFAVTDIDAGQFTSFERFGRDALGLAGAESDPVRVWLRDWSLSAAGAAWHLQASQGRYALALDMTPLLSPVLNGDRGLSQKSDAPADASYYYSIPRLQVQGRLQRDGRSFDVAGTAWLDREWGSGALSKEESGWDWFPCMESGWDGFPCSESGWDGFRASVGDAPASASVAATVSAPAPVATRPEISRLDDRRRSPMPMLSPLSRPTAGGSTLPPAGATLPPQCSVSAHNAATARKCAR